MARFSFGEVAVVVVEVADEGAVVEGRTVRGRPAAPDERCLLGPAKVGEVRPKSTNWRTIESANCTSKRVENPDLQLCLCLFGEGAVGSFGNEIGEVVDMWHWENGLFSRRTEAERKAIRWPSVPIRASQS